MKLMILIPKMNIIGVSSAELVAVGVFAVISSASSSIFSSLLSSTYTVVDDVIGWVCGGECISHTLLCSMLEYTLRENVESMVELQS
jgi:hypothetical protein